MTIIAKAIWGDHRKTPNSRYKWLVKVSKSAAETYVEWQLGRPADIAAPVRLYYKSRKEAQAVTNGIRSIVSAQTGCAGDHGVFTFNNPDYSWVK